MITKRLLLSLLIIVALITTISSLSLVCNQISCVGPVGFQTVQSAVNSISNSITATARVIWINAGVYNEKLIIPKEKAGITLQGQGYLNTAVTWSDTAKEVGGTFNTGYVQVFASNFIAKNISFKNLAPSPIPGAQGAQAVAMRIGGDMATLWSSGGVGFTGFRIPYMMIKAGTISRSVTLKGQSILFSVNANLSTR